jgi:hypothetical protein
MALKITATTGTYGTVTLPGGGSSSAWTFLVHCKITSADTTGWPYVLLNTNEFGHIASTTYWWSCHYGDYQKTTDIDPSTSYAMLAIVMNGSTGTSGHTYVVTGGTATEIYPTGQSGAGVVPATLYFGTNASRIFNDTVPCSLSYARWWKDTALSAAELETEYSSPTPVKAGCSAAWTMVGGSLSDSIGSANITMTGASYTTDTDPGYISSGSSNAARAAAYYYNNR